uniref:Uncharacterized protein n=1 Tax=Arundo donax TaxID=35708 RepID=A0A0A8ZT04_ARUDO
MGKRTEGKMHQCPPPHTEK